MSGRMNGHQFDFVYRTQSRLYSNQRTLQDNQKTALIKKREKILKKYNHWKHITISSLNVCSYRQAMWLSQHFLCTYKQCICGSYDQHQVQVPARQSRGDKTITFFTKCYFSCDTGELQTSASSASLGTPAGWDCKSKRSIISYRKVHLTDFQMALWSFSFHLLLKAGQPPPFGTPNMWKQTLRKISASYKRWPLSCVCGGHTVTFSYTLMAETVSSLFPLPRTILHLPHQ